MPGYSVKDYYCESDTGSFKEKIFLGSVDCTKAWWNFWSDDDAVGVDLTFTPGKCIGGYSLKECSAGPCPM